MVKGLDALAVAVLGFFWGEGFVQVKWVVACLEFWIGEFGGDFSEVVVWWMIFSGVE